MAGRLIKKFVKEIVKKAELDSFLKKLEVDAFLSKMGYKLNSGKFTGELLRWIIFLGFFLVALNTVGLTSVTNFLVAVLGSVVNIIIALIIFVVAVFVARFVKRIAIGAARAMKFKAEEFIGNLAAFVVYFSAFVTILGLFSVTQILLQFVGFIVIGVIFGLSLAFGLAFGLGGKEKAAEFLSKKIK